MEIATKTCTTCGLEKSLDEFPPDRRARDGKQAKCRPCINAWIKDHYRRHPAEQMIRRAKQRANKEGLEFDLDLSDILPLPAVCPVLNVPLRISTGPQDPYAHSLDRIDNSKGYVRGNVAVMSYRANRLKNDGTAEEHEAIAAWMRRQMSGAANDNQDLTRAAERVTVVV